MKKLLVLVFFVITILSLSAGSRYNSGSGGGGGSAKVFQTVTVTSGAVTIVNNTDIVQFIPAGGVLTGSITLTAPLAASGFPQSKTIGIQDPQGVVTSTNTISVIRSGSDSLNGGITAVILMNAPYSGGVLASDGISKIQANGDALPSPIRITSIVSNATPTINTDNTDVVTITALAVAITSMSTNLSGTPSDFAQLEIRIKDNGTARAIAWGASFASGAATLPTTTVAGKILRVFTEYDSVQAKWINVSNANDP